MKTYATLAGLALFFTTVLGWAQDEAGAEASVKIEVKESKEVPYFYSAAVTGELEVGREGYAGLVRVAVDVVQGTEGPVRLEVRGGGEVVSVEGGEKEGEDFVDSVKSWAVVSEGGERFLEVTFSNEQKKQVIFVEVEEEWEVLPKEVGFWHLGQGEAVGFRERITVRVEEPLDVQWLGVGGFSPVGDEEEKGVWSFLTAAGGVLRGRVSVLGESTLPAELRDARVVGVIHEGGRYADFLLMGTVVTRRKEVQVPLLEGVAVEGLPDWEGMKLVVTEAGYAVEVAEPGSYDFELPFVAAVDVGGDWQRLGFGVPSATVLPVSFSGLSEVEFEEGGLRPDFDGGLWRGFVPATGAFALGWREGGDEDDGALFFSSEGLVDVRVGSGLLRQETQVSYQVLQGELEELVFAVSGEGEILSVDGASVLSWERTESELRVVLREAVTEETAVMVQSQVAMGEFPVETQALRLDPVGTVRHSGRLRVRNEGAVRLAVADLSGLMQLAPDGFSGEPVKARQQFVYRFPSAEYDFSIRADRITPEVTVSEVIAYELRDSDRVIRSDVELDIREAGLREWEMRVPGDYSIVAVSGAQVADYVVGSEVVDGQRVLRILFGKEVVGRQLLQLQLEKNETMEAAEWLLPRVTHPAAKAVRGDVGVVGAAGFRLTAGVVEKLSEKPLSVFPKSLDGLQLVFRIRESDWSAQLGVERLPRSVQADVFHLYSLKDGTAFGSVVVNYFITGSPVAECRLEVPEDAGNVYVDGQDIRTWRREGNEVVVTLQQPVIGLYTLLLTCEESVGEQGGVVRPGRVVPLGVRAERGFVQVVSPVQVKSEVVKESEGLLGLDPLELPAEFRLSSSAPSLAVYQYTARPFEVELGVEWYQPGETVAQVVEFVEAKSRVARDGEVVTDAIYNVKTRGKRVLRMELPEGVRLWEVRVGGEPVSARQDGAETLVPLPPGANANKAVEVRLRFGRASETAKRPLLALPKVDAPVLKAEWSIEGDERRILQIEDPNVPTTSRRPETGFQALGRYGWVMGFGVLACLAGAMILSVKQRVGAMFLLVVAGGVLFLGLAASSATSGGGSSTVEVRVPVLAAGEGVMVQVLNLEAGRMQWEVFPMGMIVVGGLLGLYALVLRRGFFHWFGASVLASLGFLWMPGGQVGFLLLVGMMVVILLIRLALRKKQGDGGERGVVASSASLILISLLMLAPRGEAGLDVVEQEWQVEEERVVAEGRVVVSGEWGEEIPFLAGGVTLREFVGDGVQLVKSVGEGGELRYHLLLVKRGEEGGKGPEAGEARFSYELILPEAGEVKLPTAAAVVNELTVLLEKPGWEVRSEEAVRMREVDELGEGQSGAVLTLKPVGGARIAMNPRMRDPLLEKSEYFVEVQNLYLPAPGLLEGLHEVSVRPSQGVVRRLKIAIPEGLTVGDVRGGKMISDWRFGAGAGELIVELSEAEAEPFSFVVATQRSLGVLPTELELSPIRVAGGKREIGLLGVGFGPQAQAESVEGEGLSEVNLADFDGGVLGGRAEVLHRAYRYGELEAVARVRVVPVAAEVRVETSEVLSLGDERILLSVSARVEIARAGIFQVSFPVPEGYEVESLSGDGVSHWTESGEEAERVVTVHYQGQTLGTRKLSLVMGKAGLVAGTEDWVVPRFEIREAERQTGQLAVRSEAGLRLRAVARKNVSEIDPRSLGGRMKGGSALAFRLLQKDWQLVLGVEKLEPWLTGQVLQEVTLREGQTRTMLTTSLKVENAAVGSLLVSLPGLSEEMAKTVRASGKAVSDISPVEGEEGLWEIEFKRRVIGVQKVRIEWERTGERAGEQELILPVKFPELRQVSYYVALRAAAQLELVAGEMLAGWYQLDWTAVPNELRGEVSGGVPAKVYRSGTGGLEVEVKRHAVAEALKLRVTKGELTTVVSPVGNWLTGVKLEMNVIQRSTLRVDLEEGAELFNVFVNGESVVVVRDGKSSLFYVMPGTGERTAEVEFTYAVDGTPQELISLSSSKVSVPLENIEWRVIVPEGYDLKDFAGDLDLKEEAGSKFFGKKSYLSSAMSRSAVAKEKAEKTFERANELLEKGQQEEAVQLFQAVANNYNLDDAMNEDVRVKLERVQTDQVAVGLNSRRQRLYLDNRKDENALFRNRDLEVAAANNPILGGDVNFLPSQMGDLLFGNSAEENEVLRRIAARLVKHQKATEPAPQAIAVPIPEEGDVFVFRRAVSVDEGKPLGLRMRMERPGQIGDLRTVLVVFLVLAIAAVFAFGMRTQS
ncbi:MAG: hypothetical protein AAGC74_07910 [Verrucomicrobiota bacterium]